jgi:hypothetical protein
MPLDGMVKQSFSSGLVESISESPYLIQSSLVMYVLYVDV